ncbi:MAG: hypothetical protein R3E68_06890 [Burkholderiaceae bacterium]
MSTDGVPVIFNDSMLGGGAIAGAMAFRNHDLVAARAELGQAGAVADAYNRQQSLGVDSNGNPGAALFTTGEPRIVQGTANTGNATFDVQVIDGRQLAANDYRISLIGGQYQVSAYPGGEPQTIAGWPLEIDGLQVSIDSGAMAEGDTVVLKTAFGVRRQVRHGDAGGRAVGDRPGGDPGDGQDQCRVAVGGGFSHRPGRSEHEGAGRTGLRWRRQLQRHRHRHRQSRLGTVYPGEPIRYNGWELTLGGDPALIDRISIRPPVTRPTTAMPGRC